MTAAGKTILFLFVCACVLFDCALLQQTNSFHCASHNISSDYEVLSGNSSEVRTTLAAGTVVGKLYVNRQNGFQAQVCTAIPYATQSRFQYAEQVRRFSTNPLDATKPQPICIQFPGIINDTDAVDQFAQQHGETEDCLFISVVAPFQPKNLPGPYPVLIWVHGGAFELGSANYKGFDGAIDNFVSRGIVFVTVQYRLGPLGYLYAPPAPTNLGLYDINTAVQFVIDNIAQFGGDPTQLTLMGESAGAKSVSLLHSFSPAPRIRGSIVLSGPQAADFASDQSSAMRQLTALSGCNGVPDLAACLKRIDVKRLKAIVRQTRQADPNLQVAIRWGPVVDGRMVMANGTRSLLRQRGSVMIGTTSDEWSLFTTMTVGTNKALGKKVDYDWLNSSVAALINAQGGIRKKALATRLALYQYYDAALLKGYDESDIYKALNEVSNDIYMHAPAAKEARLTALNPLNSVWLYDFAIFRPELYTQYSALYDLSGPPHASDLAYVFATPSSGADPNYRFDAIDCEVIEKFTGAIVDFAKTGDPRGANGWSYWPPVSQANPNVYLKIDQQTTVENGFHRNATALWNELMPQIDCM